MSIGHFRFRRPSLVVQNITQVSPRLGWIDVDAGFVEFFLIGPVLVPLNRSNGEKKEAEEGGGGDNHF